MEKRCQACYWVYHGDRCERQECPGWYGEHDRLRTSLKEMTHLYASAAKHRQQHLEAAQRFGCLALTLAAMLGDNCTVVIREQLKEVREFLGRNQ